jgi:hypothetical protein
MFLLPARKQNKVVDKQVWLLLLTLSLTILAPTPKVIVLQINVSKIDGQTVLPLRTK